MKLGFTAVIFTGGSILAGCEDETSADDPEGVVLSYQYVASDSKVENVFFDLGRCDLFFNEGRNTKPPAKLTDTDCVELQDVWWPTRENLAPFDTVKNLKLVDGKLNPHYVDVSVSLTPRLTLYIAPDQELPAEVQMRLDLIRRVTDIYFPQPR
ncbi:MAG: hypothetical protein AAGA56_04895 [Myxococcota bacterium]